MKKVTTILATLFLICAMTFPMASLAQTGKPGRRDGGHGQHPWILRAISALEAAKFDLQHAAHDFCGHREAALDATDNAIRQLGLALSCEPGGRGPQTGAPGGGGGGRGGREHHPMIRRAINALERAKDDLQRAGDNFCGHKAEAIEAVNRALNQLQLALQCDKT